MSIKAAITAFSREEELEAPVCRYLRNRRFRLQERELQFYEFRMDVYAYSERDGLTVAVELKLKKWGRAVEQALLYQLCSDLVYIAMPASEAGKVNRGTLEEHGLGLISVERDRCREVVRAKPSSVLRSHYRAEFVSVLRGER